MTTVIAALDWHKALRAILWGGLIAGTLDITDAFVFNGLRGVAPVRILQTIASGLLGSSAYKGGWRTALLGGALHFFIAFSATVVYITASRWIPVLIEYAIPAGLAYGLAVYLFMNYVVLPLSHVAQRPAPMPAVVLVNGVLAIMLLVGLPIALIVRRFS